MSKVNIIEGKTSRTSNILHDSISTTIFSSNSQRLKTTKNLNEYFYASMNQFAIDLKTYYKNQRPPTDPEPLFMDPLFPPNDNSIFGLDKNGNFVDKIEQRRKDCSEYFKITPGQVDWKRPHEIFNNQPYSVFEGSVEASDSIQGGVGDCYFLSALSAIARFPQMICQIFKTNEVVENGCYQIAMRLNGEWKLIIVDDYFPCSKATSLPIFCKPNGNEIWSMLLEKVWAKVNGGYINIDAGFTVEVLNALTPFPTEIINNQHANSEQLWEKLITAENTDNILTCITSFEKDIEHYGLIAGHSCTIVKAIQRVIKRKDVRLLQIRNPWGYKEWSGKYSDNSPEWDTDTLKTLCEPQAKEDGIFWMEFADYLKFFQETEICTTKQSVAVRNIKISKDRAVLPNIFGLILDKRTRVDINIIRKSYRFNRKIIPEEYVITNILVVRYNRRLKTLTLVKTASFYMGCSLSEELRKGEYFIYFYADHTHGKYDKIRKYSFDISCSEYYTLYDCGVDDEFSLLKKIIECKLEETIKTDKSFHHIHIQCCSGFENTTFGFLYIKNICQKPHRIVLIPQLTNLYLMEEKYRKMLDESNVYYKPKHQNNEEEINEEDDESNSDTRQIEFVLVKDTPFVLLANTINFSIDASMTFDYEKYHSKDTVANQKKTIQSNIKKVNKILQGNKANVFEEYSFIYNKMKYDFTDIVQQIDHKTLAIDTMKAKYPQEMSELLKLSPLNDNEDVIFRDRYYIGDDYYFGEQHYVSMVRHGRGIYYWPHDKLKFIGYSNKGNFQGQGKFIYSNGDIHEGNFINGFLTGKGKIYHQDGVIEDVTFPIKDNID